MAEKTKHPSLLAIEAFIKTRHDGTPMERAERMKEVLGHVKLLDELITQQGNENVIQAFQKTKKLLLKLNVPIWKMGEKNG
jgi:guanylate kinase